MQFKLTTEQAREKWIEALRSGEFKQCQGTLCRLDSAGQPIGHCCLGVAIEVFESEEDYRHLRGINKDVQSYDGEDGCLTEVVRHWLGLAGTGGEMGDGTEGALWELNDNHSTFGEIADVIESAPRGLFEDVA